MPSMMYTASVEEITSRMRFDAMKRAEARRPRQMSTPDRPVQLIQDGMPIRDPAAEMPAYSAQMVPKFANSSPSAAA